MLIGMGRHLPVEVTFEDRAGSFFMQCRVTCFERGMDAEENDTYNIQFSPGKVLSRLGSLPAETEEI